MSRKAHLSGTCPLNLHDRRQTDTNDFESRIILNNDELFDVWMAALQIIRGEIGGCPHRMRFSALPIG